MTRVLTISADVRRRARAAPLLAQRLGLPFADRLLNPLGPSPAASKEQITKEELADQPRSQLLEGLLLLGTAWSIPATSDAQDSPERLRSEVERSIAELLDAGGAVILGRAAAVVIGRRSGAFHVRLDGPQERRARRGAAWEGVTVDEARTHLTKADVARARYVQRLYGRDPGDPALYHLIVDSTVITLDASSSCRLRRRSRLGLRRQQTFRRHRQHPLGCRSRPCDRTSRRPFFTRLGEVGERVDEPAVGPVRS
jgi:cytidylate kinase